MANVCVITGGESGVGLAVAKLMGSAKVVVAGHAGDALQDATEQIKAAGVDAVAFACDVCDPASVDELVAFARSLGTVKVVINAAEASSSAGDGFLVWKTNACGTVAVDEKFAAVMDEGGVVLNVASMFAYMLPENRVPYAVFETSAVGPEVLEGAFAQVLSQIPRAMQARSAYTMSKNFVVWYTKQEAVRYGARGIRFVSISPGALATPSGEAESVEAASLAADGVMGRLGEPAEVAKLMAFLVSDDCSYLDGVDILCDGGAITALEARSGRRAAIGM